tara:strand:- start:492 stop:866 length:375 start_codon:yes stop_codon:yes gene_type:complete
MALKYCQSHKCHTYDTKDRKRGSKDNRVNQTRRRSTFYYGNGNFCSLNCYDDWARDFMDRAVDQISGRLHEPITLKEENAWNKRRSYRYDNGNYTSTYFWYNMVSGRQINISEQEYRNQTQPNL